MRWAHDRPVIKDMIVQGVSLEYERIKLTTYRDPSFGFALIQMKIRCLYLDTLFSAVRRKVGLLSVLSHASGVGCLLQL